MTIFYRFFRMEKCDANISALHEALNELRARAFELDERRESALDILAVLQADRRATAKSHTLEVAALRRDIAAATLLRYALKARARRTSPSREPLSASPTTTRSSRLVTGSLETTTQQRWALSPAFRIMCHRLGKRPK